VHTNSQLGWLNLPHLESDTTPSVTAKQSVVIVSWKDQVFALIKWLAWKIVS